MFLFVLKIKFRKKTLKGFVVDANSLLIVLLKYENNKTATEKMLWQKEIKPLQNKNYMLICGWHIKYTIKN